MALFSTILYLLCGLVFLLVLAFLVFTGYLHYVHWKYSHIPQPKRPSFYLGHLPDLSKDGNQELCFYAVFLQWFEQVKSSTFVVFFFTQPTVIPTDPDSVKAIAMQPKHKRDSRFMSNFVSIFGERFMGQGILTIQDIDTWRPRRQLYDPAFKKSYLKTLLVPINEVTNKLIIERLKPLADGVTKVPMKIHFGDFMLNVISKVGFGLDVPKPVDGLNMRNINKKVLEGINAQIRFPGYKYFHPFEAAKYKKSVRSEREIGRKCIRERIQAIESGEQTPNDILTHILLMASAKESSSVDIEDLVDDFVTFFFGGQDSTMSLLTNALVLTLLHPNVLERVQQEVYEVLDTKTSVSEGDLEKFEYTEQVLKEALRLYPPFATSLPTETASNGMMLNGYHIPGGTQVMLSTGMMCHMPEYFDDPETFNPGRFDPENTRPSSFIYFPFGVGQRSCIGKHFAMMNAKVVFSRLLQTYKISLPEDYELVVVQRAAVQPKDDVYCVLQSQKQCEDC